MIARIVVVLVLAGVASLAFSVGKGVVLRRSRRATERHGWNGTDFSSNPVTVVLFTGPRCTQCDAQRAAIASARAERTDIGYTEFNAGVDTSLARRLAVLSVPTTVIVDASGNVLFRNGRLVDSRVLAHQLDEAVALTG